MLKTLFKVGRSHQKSLQGGFVCLFSESSAEYFKRDRQKQLYPIIFFFFLWVTSNLLWAQELEKLDIHVLPS